MIHTFLFIFMMLHGHMEYTIIEAPSKSACEAAKPDVLKKIIDEQHPDQIDLQCVEVHLGQVT